MITLNEKILLFQTVQERDAFGGIVQVKQEIGERWCKIVDSDGFFRDVKGGKKRIQTITALIWLDRAIDHTFVLQYNGIAYNVVNAMHDRTKGTTTLQCEFNN